MTVPEAELSRFLRQRTPRPLTPSVRRTCLPRAPWTATVGIFVISLVAMTVLASRYFPNGLLDDLTLDFGNTAVATGIVIGSQLVAIESGLPADPSDPDCVHRIDFRFSTSAGEPVLGSSHTRSTPAAANTPIDIAYLVSDPQITRAVGSTISRSSRLGLFTLLVPIPALILLSFVALRRRRTRLLLTMGVNTRARVVDVVEASTTLGLRRLCVALSFRDGRSTVIMLKKGRLDTEAILDRADANELVPVLRDLRNPRRLLLVDRLREDPMTPLEFEEGMDEFGRTLRNHHLSPMTSLQ